MQVGGHVKAARDEPLKEAASVLNESLKKKGCNTPEELDANVQSILKGDELAYYLRVKDQHDKTSQLESSIFAISSYISIGSGVFLIGLVALGMMTGGTAWALMGAVGVILAVIIAAVAVLFANFEGAQEGENMREAIRNLGPQRVKARRALMLMRAISNWVSYIKTMLTSKMGENGPDITDDMWEGDIKADFAKADHDTVVQWLIITTHSEARGRTRMWIGIVVRMILLNILSTRL